MEANDQFPPVEVFRINDMFCITDGLHRIEAALELEKETILCIIRDGTRNDAIKAAIQANVSHGLPRTNADKRNAVKLALEHFRDDSNHRIAELCAVTQPFVGRVRKQLETVTSCEPRMGRDGKKRRLPTKQKDQSSSETPNSEQASEDQANEDEPHQTGSVPETPAPFSEQDDQKSPRPEQNTPVVRQDVVQAVVAKIEKLILEEIEALVEAEIVADFGEVKRIVSI